MKRILTWLIILLALACGSRNEVREKSSVENIRTEVNTSRPEPLYCEEISNAKEMIPELKDLVDTYILEYRLQEACICVVYQYSGCERSKAFLSWDGRWPSEFHPVIPMKLRVVSPGMCDMLITDSACFSIKKLSFGGDQVGVTINGPENRLDIDFTDYQ